MEDGANYQAKAVLAWIKGHDVMFDTTVGRWVNGREQGYVLSKTISLGKGKGINQLNIAFFEHRNSDSICAVKWKQVSTNTINIDTAEFEEVYKNKWDVSYTVSRGEIVKMAEWIMAEFIIF
jgi:hypothetical protein